MTKMQNFLKIASKLVPKRSQKSNFWPSGVAFLRFWAVFLRRPIFDEFSKGKKSGGCFFVIGSAGRAVCGRGSWSLQKSEFDPTRLLPRETAAGGSEGA